MQCAAHKIDLESQDSNLQTHTPVKLLRPLRPFGPPSPKLAQYLSEMTTWTETRTPTEVSAIVNFHARLNKNEKSYTYVYPHDPPSNHTVDKRLVPIHDIRGREDEFNLDVHGFQVYKHK